MPAYAFLETPLHCPGCGAFVTDQVWFQWGWCGGRAPRPESTYRPGEVIRWITCLDGSTPPWAYLRRDGQELGANIGTPEIRELIVRDSGQVWLREACRACSLPLGGAAVEVRDGRIARGWLTREGELPGEAEYWVRASDGALVPRDWDDHPMEVRDDC